MDCFIVARRLLFVSFFCIGLIGSGPHSAFSSEESQRTEPESDSPAGSQPAPRSRTGGEGNDASFPRLRDVETVNPRILHELPSVAGPAVWPSFLAKTAVLVTALLVWLRLTAVCVLDEYESDEPSADWANRIAAVGLTGLLMGLLIPSFWISSAVVLLATLVPFQFFLRWRRGQNVPDAQRLGWSHVFRRQPKRRRERKTVRMDVEAGEPIGSDNTSITFLGKIRSYGNLDATFEGEAQHSAGFKMVMALIDQTVNSRATDLHINTKDDEVTMRMRIDGRLAPLGAVPIDLGLSVINIFKVLSDLNIADRRRSQDGSFRADVNGRRMSFRVSSQGTQTGEKLSIRILDPAQNFSDFSGLGMPVPIQGRLTGCLQRGHGLIAFVGATGAGKSTTAYAALQTLDPNDRNIITIEDPIEYNIPAIDQIEVNLRAGQTFESSLRSVLRQDADVLLIGEIRDEETARIACQAATTGQLVLATLHANDSLSASIRLIELGVDIHVVSSALRAVLAQTLIRKLCPDCRIAYKPNQRLLDELGIPEFEGGLFHPPESFETHCSTCNDRGFFRRTGVFEFLEVTGSVRELIRQRASSSQILAAARTDGFATLWEDGIRMLCEGTISVDELYRALEEM